MNDEELNAQGQRLAAGHWKWVGTCGEARLGGFLFGVDPMRYEWESLGVQVALEEPLYKQRQQATIYRIKVGRKWLYFTTTELSASVFGFWRPA